MSASAFRATYSDWRLVKTRGVIQVVFEVPLADSDKAYEVLGGMPNSASEKWFGIAALTRAKPEQMENAPTARVWRDLPPQQQAGIRCEEPTFIAFLKEQRPDDWHEAPDAAECVRLICGVDTRAKLSSDHRARVIWHQLDEQYQAWKLVEHA
jgi:hypothetical protein